MIKKFNPEKKGSAFDMNFQKQWEDSCDEGQKLVLYKSGYTAYKYVNYTCLILLVLGMVSMISFKTGILPILFVSAIYLVTTIAFTVTSMKLEK
jgi:hypothetical protein